MPDDRTSAIAAISAVLIPAVVGIASAHAAPLPEVCSSATTGADNVCSVRLTSVTANTIDGTITGIPVGGVAPITLAGQLNAYLRSAGFGNSPPDPVQRWDAAIDRVKDAIPSGPDWYGQAKSRAFLPRELNGLATQFPPNTTVVRFVPDDANADGFRLVSIQPVAK
ncbi:hypothetical protein [Mycobacterium montefiorense]|uniref:hypothetical protein n=1 Tax=Mycobacterium montefiorense TaxID=154654 RepID=UPI0021DB9A89|nr:hypothetical protein [Mycobacterium montefiorense]MCV7426493.1 hypothetical protein [Mycobacterium montefiorense]GLE53433.1 hypothetical protein ATCCBAA256_29950 [Mycobacterium montefiorense]